MITSDKEEITTLDPSTRCRWASGPWDDEPDRVLWHDGDMVCIARRGMSMGAWCGYVGVRPDHPWYGKHYVELEHVDVHGGLTYAATCAPETHDGCEFGVCHTPEPGEPDDLWWLGFDCGHAGDRVPSPYRGPMFWGMGDMGGGHEYRDLDYVRAEIRSLAQQARAASAIQQTSESM